jgi:hypothetical protein
MKKAAFLISVVFLFSLLLCPQLARSQEAWELGSKYGGKTYQTPSDPQYLSYEREAKTILLEKIKNRYGVALNANLLSSDQLLEVEALLRFKRSRESVEEVLSRFPGVLLNASSI